MGLAHLLWKTGSKIGAFLVILFSMVIPGEQWSHKNADVSEEELTSLTLQWKVFLLLFKNLL